MYVCVCVWMECGWIYESIYVCMDVCVCMYGLNNDGCMEMCMYVCMDVCVCVYVWIECGWMYVCSLDVCVCMCMYGWNNGWMFACMHVHRYVYMYVCIDG